MEKEMYFDVEMDVVENPMISSLLVKSGPHLSSLTTALIIK